MESLEGEGRLIKKEGTANGSSLLFMSVFMLCDTLRKLMRIEPCGNRLSDALQAAVVQRGEQSGAVYQIDKGFRTAQTDECKVSFPCGLCIV